jgi:hypothetical protein
MGCTVDFLAGAAAHGSLLKNFEQDATEPARRLLRGERLAGGPVCGARLAAMCE